jgi:hypothetical protein
MCFTELLMRLKQQIEQCPDWERLEAISTRLLELSRLAQNIAHQIHCKGRP